MVEVSPLTTSGTVVVGGLSIAYEAVGSGSPLVLLHGAVEDSRAWGDSTRRLSDEHLVLAWDAPGCGASADPPETFGMADYADALAGLLAALGIERADVVGHSWGGGLALQLAVTHPGLVGSLVLVGGYAGWAGSLPPDEVDRRLEVALAFAAAPSDPSAIPGLFSDRLSPQNAATLRLLMEQSRPAGTSVMARAFARCDLRAELAGIRVPTLLLHGTEDERSRPEVGAALRDALPDARLVVVPGAGHMLHLEQPAVFERKVRTFLGALRSE